MQERRCQLVPDVGRYQPHGRADLPHQSAGRPSVLLLRQHVLGNASKEWPCPAAVGIASNLE